ncbi:MAG: YCF48-related protein [Saprospiraceae bacterium]|nr:YCF48-related protein [Saprospiraceae bacterium]
MKFLIILSSLFLSFSVFGQWVASDSLGPAVTSVRKGAFPSANTGYAICMENGGFDAAIYKTSDGAMTWNNLNFSTANSPDIQCMHFLDTMTGYISVRETISGNLSMQVYKTNDGGQNWSNISPSTNTVGYGTSSVHFFTQDTGFFTIQALVYSTYDGGQNWSVDTIGGLYNDITNVDFWNGQYGVAGGWDGTFAYMGILFYTNDGGLNWNEIIIPQTYSVIQDVQRVSPTHIYALGDVGFGSAPYFFRSMDAGATWDTLDLSAFASNSMDNFKSMYFKDELNGYIGTEQGNILKTTDGGQTWTVDYSFAGPYSIVVDIDFAGNMGYAFGDDGAIAKTDNMTSIQPLQLSQEIRGFPNPATDRYYLDLGTIEDAKHINIYSLEGRMVLNEPSPKQQQIINTQSWPQGIYVGTVETEKGQCYFKIQKK